MTATTKHATVVTIVNPQSGSTRAADIPSVLKGAGIDSELALMSKHANAAELAREAIEQGADTVIACGGDGTISAVASALAGSETALGVLPLGTLNHFAKDLRIPLDPAAAARVIAQRKADLVDIGQVNGRVFVNNSSIGLYPNIVVERERRRRSGWKKWTALVAATLHALRRYPFLNVSIDVDGRTLTQRTPFVFIGNNEYEIKGLHIGSRSNLNGGRLYLYIAAPLSRAGIAGMALAALFGVIDRTRSLQMFGVEEAWIETGKSSLTVSTDGEIHRMRTPLHYRLRPRSLKVYLP